MVWNQIAIYKAFILGHSFNKVFEKMSKENNKRFWQINIWSRFRYEPLKTCVTRKKLFCNTTTLQNMYVGMNANVNLKKVS